MKVVSFPVAIVMDSGPGRAMSICQMHLNFPKFADVLHRRNSLGAGSGKNQTGELIKHEQKNNLAVGGIRLGQHDVQP
jgi:hypothetical protein